MDPSTLNPWIVLLVGVLGLGSTIWNIVSKPGAKAQADVADLAKRVDKVDARVGEAETDIARIQQDIGHLPDAQATHRQELMIAEIKGKMDVLSERLKPVAEISNRLQEFLLEQAKGR